MIKILAMIFMLIDHIGKCWFQNNIVFAFLGRLSFPCFAWGISQGAKLTKNMTLYILRVFLLGVIAQPLYYMLFGSKELNICFTFAAALVCIEFLKSNYDFLIKSLVFAAIFSLSLLVPIEYGLYGILTVLIFYTLKDVNIVILVQGLLTFIATLAYRYDPIQLVASIAPIICLILRDLKLDFKISKYFQYTFYPLHLLFLIVLKGG